MIQPDTQSSEGEEKWAPGSYTLGTTFLWIQVATTYRASCSLFDLPEAIFWILQDSESLATPFSCLGERAEVQVPLQAARFNDLWVLRYFREWAKTMQLVEPGLGGRGSLCAEISIIRVLLSPSSCHSLRDMSGNGGTRYWGTESNFIWKASRPRGWQTQVLKPHLNSGVSSSFFYIREGGARGGWDQEVMVDLRHLDVSKDMRKVVKFLILA